MKRSTKNLLITVLIAVVCTSCLGWLTAGFQNFDVQQRFEKERNPENLITLSGVSLKTTRHSNGIDITVDEDGAVTLDGKASADTTLAYGNVSLPAGDYILSGDAKGSAGTYYLTITIGSTTYYSGDAITVTGEGTSSYQINIVVKKDAQLNNAKLYPVVNSGDSAVDFYD